MATQMVRSAHALTDRIFYTSTALLLAAIVFAGFAPTFYMRTASLPALSTLLTVHGSLFTLWIVLLIAQTSFIAANRRTLHTRVGIAGMFLGVGMIVFGSAAAVDALRRGAAPLPGVDPRTFLVVPLGDIALFAGFLAAGFYFRRSPETHKRLMLVATMSLLGAAFGRIIPRLGVDTLVDAGPFAIFGPIVMLIAIGAAYDVATRGRVHRVYIWSAIVIALSVPLRFAIGSSAPWLAFADGLAR
ncbi:MAG: hypothetical protein EHM55_25300 [Acidobacteria bacterium]|nr:MAG: hypothetical protein EHM55_25300 [Acidobacteriota bacterium]